MGTKRFWRRLCWNCGLGQLPDEEAKFSDEEWRHVTIECVQAQRKATFDVHPALYHVGFRSAKEDYHCQQAVEDDAHFRWHHNDATKDSAQEDVKKRAYLSQHPLTARSFATAIPVSNVMLFSPVKESATAILDLDRPITVFDVLSAIHDDLENDLSMRDARSYLLCGLTPHVKCVERAEWGLKKALKNLQTPREALSLAQALEASCPLMLPFLYASPIRWMRVEELSDYGAAVFIDLY